jgi:hypothetical protein
MLLEEKRPVELRKGVFFDGKFRYSEFNSGNRGKDVDAIGLNAVQNTVWKAIG